MTNHPGGGAMGEGLVVSDALIAVPKLLDSCSTVQDARTMFESHKVHMLLVTDGQVLRGTILRRDLQSARSESEHVLAHSQLDGRTARPDEPLDEVHTRMLQLGLRRLAVVDRHNAVVGLLCLKASLRGFCSDAGVQARACERADVVTHPADP